MGIHQQIVYVLAIQGVAENANVCLNLHEKLSGMREMLKSTNQSSYT